MVLFICDAKYLQLFMAKIDENCEFKSEVVQHCLCSSEFIEMWIIS